MPHQHVDCLWTKEVESFNICLLQREKKSHSVLVFFRWTQAWTFQSGRRLVNTFILTPFLYRGGNGDCQIISWLAKNTDFIIGIVWVSLRHGYSFVCSFYSTNRANRVSDSLPNAEGSVKNRMDMNLSAGTNKLGLRQLSRQCLRGGRWRLPGRMELRDLWDGR